MPTSKTKNVGPAVVTDAEREAGRDARVAEIVPANRRRARDGEPKDIKATLVGEALSYRLCFHPNALVFWNGRPVAVSRAEAEYIAATALYWRTANDPETGDAVKEPAPMFRFEDADGNAIDFDLPAARSADHGAGDQHDAAYSARAAARTNARSRRTRARA